MSRPYLSVCVPTMRIGGLDVLFHGLRGQVFRDFEVVVADGVRQGSNRWFPDGTKTLDRPFTLVKPEPNPFPVNAFCKYANTALDWARGEVVVFLTDYTWLPPDCLQRHADWHKSHRAGQGYMAPHRYVALPPLHPGFPKYAPDGTDTERYAEDVLSGRLQRFSWSIFETPFDGDPRTMPFCTATGADPKLSLPAGAVDPMMFHGKNESVRASDAKRVRWNERLDGTHGWQDCDMAQALSIDWELDPSNVAYILNPRPVFPLARRLRPFETNEAVWRAGRT